jgi:hypothetical protein
MLLEKHAHEQHRSDLDDDEVTAVDDDDEGTVVEDDDERTVDEDDDEGTVVDDDDEGTVVDDDASKRRPESVDSSAEVSANGNGDGKEDLENLTNRDTAKDDDTANSVEETRKVVPVIVSFRKQVLKNLN